MIEEIKKMTVVELADLVKAIEEEFGVSAAAVAAPAAGAAGAAAEEKSSFNVVLKDAGANKIQVIIFGELTFTPAAGMDIDFTMVPLGKEEDIDTIFGAFLAI